MNNEPRKQVLWLEWSLLFIGMPIFAWTEVVPASKFLIFALPILYSIVVYRRNRPQIDLKQNRPNVVAIALRVIFGFSLLTLGVHLFLKDDLFLLPRSKPELWILILCCYPFVSAWPQEFLYRKFYFWRYQRLFPGESGLVWSSTLTFSFLHVMYDHWVPLVLTLAGGYLFSRLYVKTGSLFWPWLEHSLFGLWIFTVGLGSFFYEGP